MLTLPSANTPADTTQSEIVDVQRQIQSVSSKLGEAQASRTALERQLVDNDAHIAQLVKQIHDIERHVMDFQDDLVQLREQRSLTEAIVHDDQKHASRQFTASYSIGRQDFLKLLLNHEDPAAILRVLTYHTIIQKTHNAELQALNSDVRRISKEQGIINQKLADLDRLRKKKTATRIALTSARESREALWSLIETTIENTADELERLRLDEENLKQLLFDLGDISDTDENSEPFETLKGTLPWPAQGDMLHRFGAERGANGLSWQGVLIGADQGDEVHAISHGRVTFAEPLKGFGLLLIIDHGDGYMSLYGRNGYLFKEVGDWVRTGETVAKVAQGLGDAPSGLYFEIRHDGDPKDPVKWCRDANPLAADSFVSG